MNTTAQIDRKWRNDFVVGLRLRDAQPALIADQLKLVETHCAESGESAQEAFGDPTAYATTVAEESGIGSTAMREVAQLLPAAVGGFLVARLLFAGVLALVQGEDVSVHVGDVAAGAVIIAMAIALLWLMRSRRAAVTYVVGGGAVALAVLLDVADTARLAVLPGWVALALGATGLGILAWAVRRSAQSSRIIDPIDGTPLL